MRIWCIKIGIVFVLHLHDNFQVEYKFKFVKIIVSGVRWGHNKENILYVSILEKYSSNGKGPGSLQREDNHKNAK
jgi:hypothetical protein